MGDVIGTLLDLEHGEISYWRNKKFLGVAFRNVPKGQNIAYYPALSLSKGERAIMNFGLRPFSARLPGVCAINEPNCLVHNYAETSEFLCQKLRNFLT